jgi:hypothetical protein
MKTTPKSPQIHSANITRQLREQIGDWTDAQFIGLEHRDDGFFSYFLFILDGKWLVTVHDHCDYSDAYEGFEIRKLISLT